MLQSRRSSLCSVPELIIDYYGKHEQLSNRQSLRLKAEVLQADLEKMEKQLQIQTMFQSARVENYVMKMVKKKTMVEFAIVNCENEEVKQWLRENSDDFFQLVDMFHFLKKHIDEEEKKDHSNNIDITFLAHGSIRDSMISASCLLPLSSITDVILYSPWNCVSTADVVYGVATGRIKPQHRRFYCKTKHVCQIPDEKHRPTNLPDCWNSMKKAGDKMIPNITLSPLKPKDNVWEKFESLSKQYGQPGRNRIIIPFILPAESDSLESVPFFVVTLALSLVLLSSRFKASVHLTACLGKISARSKLDEEYLPQQYCCTIDDTVMTCSPDMFR